MSEYGFEYEEHEDCGRLASGLVELIYETCLRRAGEHGYVTFGSSDSEMEIACFAKGSIPFRNMEKLTARLASTTLAEGQREPSPAAGEASAIEHAGMQAGMPVPTVPTGSEEAGAIELLQKCGYEIMSAGDRTVRPRPPGDSDGVTPPPPYSLRPSSQPVRGASTRGKQDLSCLRCLCAYREGMPPMAGGSPRRIATQRRIATPR